MTNIDLNWMNKSLVGCVVEYEHLKDEKFDTIFLITEIKCLQEQDLEFPYEIHMCNLKENEVLHKEPVTQKEICDLIQYGEVKTEGTWTKLF